MDVCPGCPPFAAQFCELREKYPIFGVVYIQFQDV